MSSGPALAPLTEIGLKTVWFSTVQQFAGLMPALYAGSLTTAPVLFGTVDTMWTTFAVHADSKTPAISGNKHSSFPTFASKGSNKVSAANHHGHRANARVPTMLTPRPNFMSVA